MNNPLWLACVLAALGDLDNVRSLNGLEGESYVDKDLRRLLGDPVVGPFNLSYCGASVLAACRDSLWQAIDTAANATATQQGQADPALWRETACTERLRPGAPPQRVHLHQSPDVPAGARARAALTSAPLSKGIAHRPERKRAGKYRPVAGRRGQTHAAIPSVSACAARRRLPMQQNAATPRL